MDIHSFEADGIRVAIDLSVGHLASMTVRDGNREINPLHRAPWIGEEVPSDIPPGLARLSGDFFCAPFSTADIEPAPLHGWPANSRWMLEASEPITDGWRVRCRLAKKVMGATIEKILTLRDGHPFLYQEHILYGGEGELPIAHHAMTVMKDGGRLAFSPKSFALTPDDPLERNPALGRYLLAYPARADNLVTFPTKEGETTDLRDYSADAEREDFVILAEDKHDAPGWTAVSRKAEEDIFLVLKNPLELPVTMLWFSNGGRDYPPWNGRHRGVLGIEDGRTALGHAHSIGNNPLRRAGISTSITLGTDRRSSIRLVIGALSANWPGDDPVAVEPAAATLSVHFASGAIRELGFDGSFLASGN